MIELKLPNGDAATITEVGAAATRNARTKRLLEIDISTVKAKYGYVGGWHPDPLLDFALDLAEVTGGTLDLTRHKPNSDTKDGVIY